MTRNEAKKLGLHKYDNYRSCIRGHRSLRYTSTGNCIACHTIVKNDTLRSVYVRVHQDDVKLLREIVEAMNQARKIVVA